MPTTCYARLTAPGKAAISVVGVFGERAVEIVRKRLVANQSSASSALSFGRFGGDDVVVWIRSPDCVEIQHHGGVEVARMIDATLEADGARPASVEAWHERLGPSSKLTGLLSRCLTARTAAIVLDQMNGAFAKALAEIAVLRERGEVDIAEARLARLHALIPVGRHLDRPWRVALAGAPNVGKSSLVNAFAGYTRSLVAPTPGTTRDVVSATIALEGWPIELTDTAGLRTTTESMESQGIERARVALAEADLVLWIVDGSDPTPVFESPDGAFAIVINKVDLPSAWNFDSRPDAIRVSAQSGQGMAELGRQIVERLVPNPPMPGEAVEVIPNAAQIDTL